MSEPPFVPPPPPVPLSKRQPFEGQQPPQYGPPPGPPGPPAQAPTPWYRKPWAIVLGALLVIGLIGSAVNGGKDESASTTDAAASSAPATVETSAAPPPTTEAVAPAPAPPPATTTPPPPAPAPPVVDFAMPNLVGLDLQTAQNTIQTYGVFFSVSHDLLGSRNQLVDSNWIVCTQNIPPGQQVTGDAEGLIDLGAVKRGEPCP